MFKQVKILVALLAVLSAHSAAQDFDSQVTRDPERDLAIYDFHFAGPPRGHAWLFVSPFLMEPPLPLPGNVGPLFLDPGTLLPVSPFVPLDSRGQGKFRLILPDQATDAVAFYFQPVIIDPLNIVRVAPRAKGLIQGKGRPNPKQDEGFAIGYDHREKVVDFRAWGEPNRQMTLQIFDENERLVDTIDVVIGPNRTSPTGRKKLTKPVKRGYTWKLWEKQGSTLIPVRAGRF